MREGRKCWPGTKRRRGPRLRAERGVALVEFALVAPLLMLLLFGMLDFGKAFAYWIDETHLANTGARMAVVNNWPTKGSQTLQEYLVEAADTGELQENAIACVDFLGPQGVGEPVRVTVKVPYQWLPIVTNLVGIGPKTITASSTMRLEKNPPYDYDSADNDPDNC